MARRLAAILAADVVGYSRLMAVDEAGMHARLKALRQDFIEPKIAEHHGRVAKLMGDGALVEFASVVDALECAAAIQSGVAERQAERPEEERIAFRIGINIGDVIIEGDDIYGDGVNVAARLEALAEPGEICVSRTVYNHAKAKVAFAFEPMGEHRVKNIPEPVTVYRVITDAGPLAKVLGLRRFSTRPWRLVALTGAAAVVLLLAAGGAGLWLRSEHGAPPALQQTTTPVTATQGPGVARQVSLDRYRIAVLPFANISADPDDEYFSDGMTEELISKLSRLHDLSVIARTSVMQYKDTGKGVAEIGRELQVGTILEGSVRKAGERLRITAQLIDVTSQAHLWSEDYDRELTDVFGIQSDVAQHVARALQITLKPAEKRQIEKAGTDDLYAYDAYLKGLYHANTWSKEDVEKGIEYFEEAVARDPSFAKAYATMAFSYEVLSECCLPPDEAFPKLKEAAHRALAIDATTAEAHTALAVAATYERDWIRADEGYRRALELNPNSAIAHDWYGVIYLTPTGRHEEGIAHGKRAKELDPLTAYVRYDLGFSYNFARRYDEAIAECEQIMDMDPSFSYTYWCLGYAYWQKGMLEEAVATYERGVSVNPDDLRVKAHLAMVYADAGDKARAQQIVEEFEEKARREYVPAMALAWAYMAVGDLDGAFASMNKVYEQRHAEVMWMNVHVIHDRLRGDPRFRELMRKIGFTEAQIHVADALADQPGR